MSSNQRNKRTCTENTNFEKKLRRRDTYGKISADEKEAMLLQRRTKKMEVKKCTGSTKSVVDCPAERIKCPCDTILSKETTLTIRESSSVSINHETPILSTAFDKGKEVGQSFHVFERGSTCDASEGQQNAFVEVITNKGTSYEIPTLSAVFDKGKDVGHSFCVFERGSTSGTSKGQQNASTEVVTNKEYLLSNQELFSLMGPAEQLNKSGWNTAINLQKAKAIKL